MKGIVYSNDFFKIATDIDVVVDHLKRSLLTTFGERVQNYNYGSAFRQYIFNFEPIIRQDIIAEFERIVEKEVPAQYEVFDVNIDQNYEEHKIILTFSLRDKATNEVIPVEQDFLREEE
jgi:phage baseplate assembly protein W